jgi:hypothetical protein
MFERKQMTQDTFRGLVESAATVAAAAVNGKALAPDILRDLAKGVFGDVLDAAMARFKEGV